MRLAMIGLTVGLFVLAYGATEPLRQAVAILAAYL